MYRKRILKKVKEMGNIDIFPLNEYENDRKRNRRKRIERMSSEKERNK